MKDIELEKMGKDKKNSDLDYLKQRENLGFAFHFNEKPDVVLPSLMDKKQNRNEAKPLQGGLFHSPQKITRNHPYSSAKKGIDPRLDETINLY